MIRTIDEFELSCMTRTIGQILASLMAMIESASDVCQIEWPCSLLIAMVVTFLARRRLLPCNRVHICSHEFVTCVFALFRVVFLCSHTTEA